MFVLQVENVSPLPEDLESQRVLFAKGLRVEELERTSCGKGLGDEVGLVGCVFCSVAPVSVRDSPGISC